MTKTKITSHLIVFILSFTVAIGQPTTVKLNSIGKEQGLSNTINAFFFQDQSGFIWISSIDGLNRFDGRRVKVYKPNKEYPLSIKGSNIQSSFFEDKQGDIWFTTDQSINCHRKKSDSFEHYFIEEGGGLVDNSNYYAFKLDDKDRLSFIANNHYYILDTKNPSKLPEKIIPDKTFAIRASSSTTQNNQLLIIGCFWEMASGFESIVLDSNLHLIKKKIHYQNIANNNKNTPLKTMGAFVESDSLAWLCTNKGLLKFSPTTSSKFKYYPAEDKNGVLGFQPYGKDQLLVIDRFANIRPFDKKKGKYGVPIQYSNPSIDKLTNPIQFQSLWVNKDQILWTSDYSTSIFFANLQKSKFKSIWYNSHQTQSISSFFEDKNGKIWCIADNGRNLVIDQTYKVTTIRLPEFSTIFQSIDKNQHLFIPGKTPLKRYKYLEVFEYIFKSHALPPTYYKIVPFDGQCTLIGTFSGLFYKKNNQQTIDRIEGINFDVFHIFIDAKGMVWIGGGDQIACYQVGPKMEFTLIKSFDHTGLVLHFFKDNFRDNILWAATGNGLRLVNLDKLVDTLISEQSGLPNQYIYAIAQDKKGNLWLSTNQGIIRFNPDQKPYKFKQYTTSDGLSSNEFNSGAALMDSRGYLWFGSTKGIDVFHPDSIHDLGHAPQLAIVGLKIHDQEWRGDTAIEVVQRIQLPYNQNTLRLELAAMEYLDPERNKFKVLLQLGTEQATWTDLGTQNFVTYANLKPGKYTFKFIACNAEGIWNDEKDARVLYIDIHPHWSDTWWFRTLLATLILGFVAVATALYYRYQLRVQQLQNEKIQREAERQRMELEKNVALADGQRKVAESEMKLLRSQLNPHFLFNAMNSINRYILSNEKEKASEYLGQFAQLTRSILDNSRSRTIALADELKMLHHYLSLENHRFRQQINWTFTISPDLDEEDVQVPSMLLQPFAENAILHGLAPKGGGHIAIEISEHENRLQCIIRDDGVGRQVRTPLPTDEKPKHASVGMRLISEQLDAFAGLEGQSASIAINDLQDAEGKPTGTEVVIILPLVYHF